MICNICNFCKNEFEDKYTLERHIKTSKRCLEKRGEKQDDFSCNYCYKIYANKYTLKRHDQICKEKTREFINNLKQENDILKKEHIKDLKTHCNNYKELAEKAIEKPINIQNNNVNDNSVKKIDQRILNLSSIDDLKNGFLINAFGENFNQNHLMKGIEGLISFCIDTLIKTPDNKLRMLCTDPNRDMFVYRDDQGQVHRDIGAKNFIKMISQPTKKRVEKVYQEMVNSYNELKSKIEEDQEDEISDDQEDEKVYLNIEQQRLDYAFNKKLELQSIDKNPKKFVKKLGKPLYNSVTKIDLEEEQKLEELKISLKEEPKEN
jgi:GTP cyclohydrolase I